jgi:hypothetical protein
MMDAGKKAATQYKIAPLHSTLQYNVYLFLFHPPCLFLCLTFLSFCHVSLNISLMLGRWVAKLVARLLATATLWVLIRTYLKNTKKYMSKGLANTHLPPPPPKKRKKALYISLACRINASEKQVDIFSFFIWHIFCTVCTV